MFGATIVILLFLGALGGGAWVWLRTRREHLPVIVRLLLALVPFGAAVAMYLILWTLFNAPNLDWNGGKLAPIVAMIKAKQFDEHKLYQSPDTGVMTAWIYGPMPALLFLPAAIATRPTNEILIAVIINICLYWGPALWAHLRLGRTPVQPLDNHASAVTAGLPFTMFVFLIFTWITLDHESLCRAAMMIAPDAPTLAFAISSIMLLFYRRNVWILIGSALCAVCACWSKQSAIPFLFVAPLYILIVDGRIAAAWYALILAIVGAGLSTILLLAFGAHEMYFHMVKLSASHGWEFEAEMGRPLLLLRAMRMLLFEMAPTLGIAGFIWLVQRYLLPPRARAGGSRKERFVVWARLHPWIMFVIAAVFLVPSALLGFLKVGGYVNNFSLVHVFVALTVSAMLIQLYARIRSLMNGTTPIAPPLPLAPATLRALVLAFLAIHVLWDWPDIIMKPGRAAIMYRPIARPWDNQQETIYDFVKANPGLVYFPWNNLSMLLAEGRQYHFEWGIHDRYEAGITPSDEQIRKHIPADIQYIGYGPFHQGEETQVRWFPHWTAEVRDERLKKFTIYTLPRQQPAKTLSSDFDLTPRAR